MIHHTSPADTIPERWRAAGTIHGMQRTGAVLDLPRIATLREHVDAALMIMSRPVSAMRR